jgi:hypothetical protein
MLEYDVYCTKSIVPMDDADRFLVGPRSGSGCLLDLLLECVSS